MKKKSQAKRWKKITWKTEKSPKLPLNFCRQLHKQAVAARGAKPRVLQSTPAPKMQSSLVGEIVFEHEDLNKQIPVRKASGILQKALTPGTILCFPPNFF